MAPDASHALAEREKVKDFLNAACTGNLEDLKKLAQQLDDGKGLARTVVDVKDANKRGALHFAAREGQTEVCKYLIEELNVDANLKDEDGETPLTHAARQGHTSTAKYLIDHGADPSIPSELGTTALHHTAGIGDIELLKFLLTKNVEVDLQSDAGTPLIWAAGQAQPEAVKVLLENNANDGSKPIQVAAARGNRTAVEILFPVSSQISNVQESSVDGLLEHMQSETGQKEVSAEAKKKAAEAKTRGDDAFKRKDYMAAIDAYTQAIDFDTTDATLLSNRSLCWIRIGQAELALADGRECKALRPDWAKACYREGAALRLLQKFKEAANAFYEGVQLQPENMELFTAFRDAVEAGQ